MAEFPVFKGRPLVLSNHLENSLRSFLLHSWHHLSYPQQCFRALLTASAENTGLQHNAEIGNDEFLQKAEISQLKIRGV